MKLLSLLRRHPRKSYKELADALKISTPAVHKRVLRARESGVLVGPYACISPSRLGAVPVMVIGRSDASGLKELAASLGKSDRTNLVTVMGGNVVLVRGILADIEELDGYSAFVGRAARMAEPEIFISSPENEPAGKGGEEKLTKLDLRIIRALREDGRKSVKDVADEVGATPKTVRRRLARLKDTGLMALDLFADQSSSGNFVPLLRIELNRGIDKKEVGRGISEKFSPGITRMMYFGNRPNIIIAIAWLHCMADLHELVEGIGAENGVKSVVPNILIASMQFDSWLDKIVDDPSRAEELLRKKNLM